MDEDRKPDKGYFVGIIGVVACLFIPILQANGVDLNWQTSLMLYVVLIGVCEWSLLNYAIPHLRLPIRLCAALIVLALLGALGAYATNHQYKRDHVSAVISLPPQPHSSTMEAPQEHPVGEARAADPYFSPRVCPPGKVLAGKVCVDLYAPGVHGDGPGQIIEPHTAPNAVVPVSEDKNVVAGNSKVISELLFYPNLNISEEAQKKIVSSLILEYQETYPSEPRTHISDGEWTWINEHLRDAREPFGVGKKNNDPNCPNGQIKIGEFTTNNTTQAIHTEGRVPCISIEKLNVNGGQEGVHTQETTPSKTPIPDPKTRSPE